MSSKDIAISVRDLGKAYTIARDQEQHITLTEMLLSRLSNPLRRPKMDTFWALKDLSFDINQGEVVGIIGRNGAGKSTLLKVLSRITEPTTGAVDLFGRVGSLLEVGTGFHPELTGRENIFLNGAILGMNRPEIKKHFDAIVDFAGVSKFLDTPVKRYSSGMYVRLAFAVAAHLSTEILIIDEVLAVGDAEFQKKCLSKMSDVASAGRTVLFVSHNMGAVQQLCNRVLRLVSGQLIADTTDVRAGVMGYLMGSQGAGTNLGWVNPGKAFAGQDFVPQTLILVDQHGNGMQGNLSRGMRVYVEVTGTVFNPSASLRVGYMLRGSDGELLYETDITDSAQDQWPAMEAGYVRLRTPLPLEWLNEGSHQLELTSSIHVFKWICRPGNNSPSITFNLQGPLSQSPYWRERREGSFAPQLPWVSVNDPLESFPEPSEQKVLV